MTCTRDTTIVFYADEHDAAVTVCETHHCVDDTVVRQRCVRFGDELGRELLAGCDESAKLCVGEQKARVR